MNRYRHIIIALAVLGGLLAWGVVAAQGSGDGAHTHTAVADHDHAEYLNAGDCALADEPAHRAEKIILDPPPTPDPSE